MLKDKLKDAIYSRNWGMVCNFYESMFGEVIELPSGSPEYADIDSIKKKALEIIEECASINMGDKSNTTTSFPEKDLGETNSASGTSYTGSVTENETASKTQFIASDSFDLPEDDMEGYKEAVENAHKNRTKVYREEYQANLMTCPGCKQEFDFNKEYPSGLLESSREPKCNKCRAIPAA